MGGSTRTDPYPVFNRESSARGNCFQIVAARLHKLAKQIMAPDRMKISFEDAARIPRPGSDAPSSIGWSPDGAVVTYLQSGDGSLTQQLYGFVPSTGKKYQIYNPGAGDTEETLTLEEKLRRERTRTLGVGVTSYSWGVCRFYGLMRLLVPLHGGLYVQDFEIGCEEVALLPRGGPRCVVESSEKPVIDGQLSPDGCSVAFVRDEEVYVCPLDGGEAKQVTHGARGTGKTHGLAEYCAMEEMERNHGYWWSPDSQRIAFAEVDETHIPVFRIIHQGSDSVGDGAQEDHRYPFTGGPNAVVRLGVVNLADQAVTWFDLSSFMGGDDFYLARVHWTSRGHVIAACMNRLQTELKLIRLDPSTGEGRVMLTETTNVWINLYPEGFFLELPGSEHFLWMSERTGFRHLYIIDHSGNVVRQLTSGDWQVDKVVGMDAARGLVYFMANESSPLECHLYSVPLAGGSLVRYTNEPGMHECYLNPEFTSFVDAYSSLDTPPRVTVKPLEKNAAPGAVIKQTDGKEIIKTLGLVVPEIVEIKNDEGVTLYGAIYAPEGKGPHPLVVSVYGGPHVQRVQNAWAVTVDMRPQLMAQQGMMVFKLDNRGSSRRGLAFEGAIKHNMGKIEVDDQVTGVSYLVERGLADPRRVGIFGWSYGGYMSLMTLMRRPDVFHVAVSGAPVTHWDAYDTCYTERYMGLPKDNAEGYERSSVMAHVSGMRGKLLMIHGLIDENVHFRHTARLINRLIKERKTYDLLLLPDERHSPRSLADRIYMESRIFNFFAQEFGMSVTL